MTGFIVKYRRIFYSSALFIIMFAFLCAMGEELLVSVCFSLIYLFALLIFAFKKDMDDGVFLVAAAASAALVYVRVCLLAHVTGDYAYGFEYWMEDMLKYPGMTGLAQNIGNYNTPYMFILWLIAKSGLDRLVLVKAVNCVFDVMLAYYVMKCVELKTDKKAAHFIAFIAALGLPTVFLNSAYWGQCDMIFTAFAVASVYYGIKGKSAACVLMFSIGFAFKLHPIFLAAGFAALFMNKRLDWRHIWIFFAVYVGAQLPAFIAGMNVFAALARPFTGMEGMTYDSMVLNAPTLWSFFPNVSYEMFSTAAIFLAGAAVLCFGYYVWSIRARIKTPIAYMLIFYLSTMIMTYLLPSMHERYYCISDSIALILVFYDSRKWYIPFVTCLGSLLSYMPYLTGITLIEFPILSAAFLLVIVLALRELSKEANKEVSLEG